MKRTLLHVVAYGLIAWFVFIIGFRLGGKRVSDQYLPQILVLTEQVEGAKYEGFVAGVEQGAKTVRDACVQTFETRNIYQGPPIMTFAQSLAGHGYDPVKIRRLICGQ